jgi:capsular exopolysaccharide synthesis family protein
MNQLEEIYANKEMEEAVKTLVMNIKFASIDKPVHAMVLTSTVPSEGKSTVSACLARALCGSHTTCLLVETDFRKPRLRKLLGLPSIAGLSDVLFNDVPIEQVIQETDVDGFFFLNSGRKINSPIEVLSSKRHAELVGDLRKMFDYVIFDSPPVGLFVDSAVVAPLTDGVIYVVKSGKVNAKQIKAAMDQLKKADAHIIGTVLNGSEETDSYYYNGSKYYYSNYSYYTGEGAGKKRGPLSFLWKKKRHGKKKA